MTVTSEMLAGVKQRLGETGSFEETDAVLTDYISDVIDYMIGAGVSYAVIVSHIGVVARGVDDMFVNGAGSADFSPMFRNMVTQLVYRS
ncbi:MAG: hypothetical protein IJ906_11475 [Oscillospiraceae bacterium]|jgi:hypothetical protein|nr:hypothetical protein [Oscillospiraceae bacterium]